MCIAYYGNNNNNVRHASPLGIVDVSSGRDLSESNLLSLLSEIINSVDLSETPVSVSTYQCVVNESLNCSLYQVDQSTESKPASGVLAFKFCFAPTIDCRQFT